MTESFFTTPDGDWFQPTDFCRGPWDPHACHAGPPTGLLARASELTLPDQPLRRLTVDLVRPIPHAGFRIVATVTRRGRTVSTTEMTLVDAAGKHIVTARGMHLAEMPPSDLPTPRYDTPRLAEATPAPFPIDVGAHALVGFRDAVEVRYPPGDAPSFGPGRMWMRTIPLLPDEPGSGFQRICPLADCGNAVSANAGTDRATFMNTDLTVLLHREPQGEWFGMDSVSRWEPTGAGISDSLLFDEHGPVGRALQTLLIRNAHVPGS